MNGRLRRRWWGWMWSLRRWEVGRTRRRSVLPRHKVPPGALTGGTASAPRPAKMPSTSRRHAGRAGQHAEEDAPAEIQDEHHDLPAPEQAIGFVRERREGGVGAEESDSHRQPRGMADAEAVAVGGEEPAE